MVEISSNTSFEPGDLVRNARQPDWGLGQVQSVANGKITVNFEEMGKQVMVLLRVNLIHDCDKRRGD